MTDKYEKLATALVIRAIGPTETVNFRQFDSLMNHRDDIAAALRQVEADTIKRCAEVARREHDAWRAAKFSTAPSHATMNIVEAIEALNK